MLLMKRLFEVEYCDILASASLPLTAPVIIPGIPAYKEKEGYKKRKHLKKFIENNAIIAYSR